MALQVAWCLRINNNSFQNGWQTWRLGILSLACKNNLKAQPCLTHEEKLFFKKIICRKKCHYDSNRVP